jgi:CBS domain-containing membrane protein
MTDDVKRDEVPEIELSDEDILDAMKQMSGYIDVFADDFRTIYHHAHRHAVSRLTAGLRADLLMRKPVPPLAPEMSLRSAAQVIARSGYKGLPVTDASGIVVGILTETDFLRHLGFETLLEFLLASITEESRLLSNGLEASVSEIMTAPAICVRDDAGFNEIFHSFRSHEGRILPVVDELEKLKGLLLRKDFLMAAHLESML